MKPIEFFKMSGSGNDFIIIDNRNQIVDKEDLPGFISSICQRKLSVGADGLILVENCEKNDFKWHFFNSDGTRADMCGNGARCVARFAHLNGIAESSMAFETDVGVILADMTGKNDRVRIKMTDPVDYQDRIQIETDLRSIIVDFLNTGVPHAVIETEDVDKIDVTGLGRAVRFHERFAPNGVNANFYMLEKDGTILVNRTYERGVEDETLACGTGCVAVAVTAARRHDLLSPVVVRTKSSGYLTVHFQRDEDRFFEVYLEGDARIIYKGELFQDAWNY